MFSRGKKYYSKWMIFIELDELNELANVTAITKPSLRKFQFVQNKANGAN